jgi:tetratricopeptide (TPR) repeat protein
MRDDTRLFVLMYSLLTHLGLDRQTVDRTWLEVYELVGWNLINYGKIKEAVSLLEQVVKISEQTLAEDHSSRQASQHVLATIYWDVGRHNTALQIMKDVVQIHWQVLDEHHPARTGSEVWLEQFEREMGNMQHLSSFDRIHFPFLLQVNSMGGELFAASCLYMILCGLI